VDAFVGSSRRSSHSQKTSLVFDETAFSEELMTDIDAGLASVIVSFLDARKPNAWMKLTQIYAASSSVDQQNSLASRGLSRFIMPSDLLQAAYTVDCLEVRHSNGDWEVRKKQRDTKKTSKSIAAVLRYDVEDWLKIGALQTLVYSRSGHRLSFGALFLTVLQDPARFELDWWRGDWWVRATYRH
jgi:hypothetical protein